MRHIGSLFHIAHVVDDLGAPCADVPLVIASVHAAGNDEGPLGGEPIAHTDERGMAPLPRRVAEGKIAALGAGARLMRKALSGR